MIPALQEPSRSPLLQLHVFLFIFPAVGWKRFLLPRDTWTLWKVIITQEAAQRYRVSLIGLLLQRQAIRWWGAEKQQLIDNHCLSLKVNHTPQTLSHNGEWDGFLLVRPSYTDFPPARCSRPGLTLKCFQWQVAQASPLTNTFNCCWCDRERWDASHLFFLGPCFQSVYA